MEETKAPAEPRYAIVEIMGHRTHAGIITEIQEFGTTLMRIDVPKEGNFGLGVETYTYGGSAIFSYRLATREEVCEANMSWEKRRVLCAERYHAALPAPEAVDVDWDAVQSACSSPDDEDEALF